MFTGLVETTAKALCLEPRSNGARLTLDVGGMTSALIEGESIAVNGCCLTATNIRSTTVSFDLLEQTLRVTNLGDLAEGSVVNLERALRVGDRLGGHFVQGHVDATATILFWGLDGTDYRLTITLPSEGRGLVIPKGSICLDGISLTAAEVTPDEVTCWIIPHTHAVTNLHARSPGQRINVEFDMLGKYVRQLSLAAPSIPA
jgi:riboflavin synthase